MFVDVKAKCNIQLLKSNRKLINITAIVLING